MPTEEVIPAVCDPRSDVLLRTLVELAIPYCGYFERDARYLIDKIDQIVAAGTWYRLLDNEPKTWERFCTEVLGCDARYFDNVRAALMVSDKTKSAR